MFYADSSFLASLYLPDAKTGVANSYLGREQTPLIFTPFNRVELRNALRNMVARGEAKSGQVARAFSLMENDLNEGLLVERILDQAKLLNMAERLSARHAERHAIRCVDLLHVAGAHVLSLKTFLTFDPQQATFAQATGLMIKP